MARGDSWFLRLEGQNYLLDYISGELAGREKTIEISRQDAQRLIDNDASIDEILIAYGAH